NRWTNPDLTGWLVTNLNHYANWFQHPSNAFPHIDYGLASAPPDLPLLLAAGFDWMYNYLGADTSTFKGRTRTNLALAIHRCLIRQTHGGAFYIDSLNGGYPPYLPNYNYPQTAENVTEWSLTKMANSHPDMSAATIFP